MNNDVRQFHYLVVIRLLLGHAKVNKVKIFSGFCYMIKCVGLLTFVSGVQESVLVDFISQNKAKFCIKSKFVKIVFIKNFLTKTNKCIFFKYFFELLSCY